MLIHPAINEESLITKEESSVLASMQPIDSIEQVPSSSCGIELNTLEGETFLPDNGNEAADCMHYNDTVDDDDEMFDSENFENDDDDDDDGDAFPGEGGRSSRGKWTQEEDETLREAVQRHGGRNWKRISDCLEGRTDVQCLHRWQKVLRPGLIKGPWTKEVKNATTS